MTKVLIIAYYWPPAGGPGVQRWLKFVKYFAKFGIEPIVYVPENPTYPITDASLSAEIPKDVTVLKQPIQEPYKLASVFSKKKTKTISSGIITKEKQSIAEKIMLWVRGNFFIPDARKAWVKPSVDFLSTYIQNNAVDAIITTGPPHSMHLIGMQLQATLGVKWLADFRDPWTNIGYHKQLKLMPFAKKKHEQLEIDVLQKADAITVTSFTTKDEFASKTKTPINVITNGYDVEQALRPKLSSTFTVAHIGSLLSGRNPIALWKALSSFLQQQPAAQKDFELVLAGRVSQDVMSSIEANGLLPYVKLLGYISHDEAVALQRSAQVLLLLEIDAEETKGIIPGKLFEYMAAERPILAVGPDDWDAAKIIKKTNTGTSFLYSEKSNIEVQLLSWYEQYQNKTLKVYPIGLQFYSRVQLTQKMANFIKSIVT